MARFICKPQDLARLVPFINALNEGRVGAGPRPPCDGEALALFEVAARYGRIRYSVIHMGCTLAWFDDLHGWVVPELMQAGDESSIFPDLVEQQAALAQLLGPHLRVPSTSPVGRFPHDAGGSGISILTLRWFDGDTELGVFAVTAYGQDGVRFWFVHDQPGAGLLRIEEEWRLAVLDVIRRCVHSRDDPRPLLERQVRRLSSGTFRGELRHEWAPVASWSMAEALVRDIVAGLPSTWW